MREFDYRHADDVTGAVALLDADPDARYLGGGTNLVDLMKNGVETPPGSSTSVPSRSTGSRPPTTAPYASVRPSPTATSPPTR